MTTRPLRVTQQRPAEGNAPRFAGVILTVGGAANLAIGGTLQRPRTSAPEVSVGELDALRQAMQLSCVGGLGGRRVMRWAERPSRQRSGLVLKTTRCRPGR